MLAFIVSASFAQTKEPNFKIDTSLLFMGHLEICQVSGEKPKFIMSYDFLDSPLVVTMVNHKPVANKPYKVFIRNHSLIIFSRGVKIGAVKWITKPYQLTYLKLN